MIEKNIDKKLANRISYQIRYKRCSKGKFGTGVQTCEGGGPYPSADMDLGGGGPNLRRLQIHCDTSAKCP